MGTEYFGQLMVDRQLLFWAIATRRQLERWEICVAEIIRLGLESTALPGQLVWRSEAERHFVFIAARNLVRAAGLAADPLMEASLAETLKDVRDLLEHWDENAPVFNVSPQGVPSQHSGRRFAARHERTTPYSSFEWNSKEGPLLLPAVPAAVLHEALNQVEMLVIRRRPELVEYVPERPLGPWLGGETGEDRWWPK